MARNIEIAVIGVGWMGEVYSQNYSNRDGFL
jgi:hypothetical protein